MKNNLAYRLALLHLKFLSRWLLDMLYMTAHIFLLNVLKPKEIDWFPTIFKKNEKNRKFTRI